MVVIAGEKVHPIISIRQSNSGKLIITPRKAIYNIDDRKNYKKTLDQKYTVHEASALGNNTIHHTIISEDGSKVETHIVTSALKSQRVEMFLMYTLGNLKKVYPRQSPRKKDEVLTLARYDPEHSVLHIAFFLAPAKASLDLVPDSPLYQRKMINLENYSIICVFCYSHIASLDEGWLFHYATAQITFNGEKNSSDFLPIAGLAPKEASGYVITQLNMAHFELFKKIINIVGEKYINVMENFLFFKSRIDQGIMKFPLIPYLGK